MYVLCTLFSIDCIKEDAAKINERAFSLKSSLILFFLKFYKNLISFCFNNFVGQVRERLRSFIRAAESRVVLLKSSPRTGFGLSFLVFSFPLFFDLQGKFFYGNLGSDRIIAVNLSFAGRDVVYQELFFAERRIKARSPFSIVKRDDRRAPAARKLVGGFK